MGYGNYNTKKQTGIFDIVLVALFAAITFLGVQIFRIPLPAAVGSPFIHFGNSFVVLSVLLLGGKRGAIAGAVGLGLFDIINGYGSYAPTTIIMALMVALVVNAVFSAFKRRPRIGYVFIAALSAGATKIVLEFVFGTVRMLLTGSQFSAAVIGAFTSLPATAINAVSTVIIVTILFMPLRKGLDAIEQGRR